MSLIQMKRFIVVIFFFMPISSVFGMQDIWDFNKDKPYWGVKREIAKCPGPHFRSIWFKDFGHSILRYCIDNESKINLSNGGRARFVIVSFQRENSITVEVLGIQTIVLSGNKLIVIMESGRSSGYQVQNKSQNIDLLLLKSQDGMNLSMIDVLLN